MADGGQLVVASVRHDGPEFAALTFYPRFAQPWTCCMPRRARKLSKTRGYQIAVEIEIPAGISTLGLW